MAVWTSDEGFLQERATVPKGFCSSSVLGCSGTARCLYIPFIACPGRCSMYDTPD